MKHVQMLLMNVLSDDWDDYHHQALNHLQVIYLSVEKKLFLWNWNRSQTNSKYVQWTSTVRTSSDFEQARSVFRQLSENQTRKSQTKQAQYIRAFQINLVWIDGTNFCLIIVRILDVRNSDVRCIHTKQICITLKHSNLSRKLDLFVFLSNSRPTPPPPLWNK